MAYDSSEVRNVQNASLGAVLLWKFGLGYQEEAQLTAASFILFFIPLSICFHRPTLDLLLSTRMNSGLALFAAKLSESREELLAVHERVLAYRALTLDCICIGVNTGLFTVDYSNAQIRANLQRDPVYRERLKPMITGAGRLGTWCARHPLEQTTSILGLEF